MPAVSAAAEERTLQVGRIINQRNGECLQLNGGAGAQLRTLPCRPGSDQLWYLVAVGTYYEVRSAQNGMCVSVRGGGVSDWEHVVLWPCEGSHNQHWVWASVGGWYQVSARHSHRCLDISWGWAIQYGCNNSTNQRFTGPQ